MIPTVQDEQLTVRGWAHREPAPQGIPWATLTQMWKTHGKAVRKNEQNKYFTRGSLCKSKNHDVINHDKSNFINHPPICDIYHSPQAVTKIGRVAVPETTSEGRKPCGEGLKRLPGVRESPSFPASMITKNIGQNMSEQCT